MVYKCYSSLYSYVLPVGKTKRLNNEKPHENPSLSLDCITFYRVPDKCLIFLNLSWLSIVCSLGVDVGVFYYEA